MADQALILADITQRLQQALPLAQFTIPFDGSNSVVSFLENFNFQCQLKSINTDIDLLRSLAIHLIGAPLQLFQSRVNLENLNITFAQFSEILKITFSPRVVISDIEVFERSVQDISEPDLDFAFRALKLFQKAYPNDLVEINQVVSIRRKFRAPLRDYLDKHNIPTFADLISLIKKFQEKSSFSGNVGSQANLQAQIDDLSRQLKILKSSQNVLPAATFSHPENFPASKPKQVTSVASSDPKARSDLFCRYCKAPGHLLESCFKLENKKKREAKLPVHKKENQNNANFFYSRGNPPHSRSPKRPTPFRNTTVPLNEFSPKKIHPVPSPEISPPVVSPSKSSKSKRKRRSRKKAVATPNGLFTNADFESSGTSLEKILYFRCTSSAGHKLKMVVDSGSAENMIDSRLAESLNCKIQTSPSPVTLTSASGNSLRVANYVEFKVHMPSGINISCHRFYVVKNLPTSVIAGSPFLLEKRAQIDYDTGYLTIRNSLGSSKIMLCGVTKF